MNPVNSWVLLDLIRRRIAARAKLAAVIEKAKARNRMHESSGSRWTRFDEMLFQDYLDRLSFERRGDLEGFNRKLERQEVPLPRYG